MRRDKDKKRASENNNLPSTSTKDDTVQEQQNKYNFWWWHIESITNDTSENDTSDSDSDLNEMQITKPKTFKNARKQLKPAKMMVEMDLKKIFENTTEAALRVKLSSAAHLEILSTFVNQ